MRMRYSAYNYLWSVILLSQFLTACGTMKNGRGWGQDATLLPGTKRIGHAAMKAVSDPKTWAPVAGAAVLGATGLDGEISQWAYKNTPLFGSTENAVEWSDDLVLAAELTWITTTLVAPSGNNLQEVAFAKFKGIAIEVLAVSATRNLTGVLKKATKRKRPNEFDDESFPSAHASQASVYSFLAMRNLRAVSINNRLKRVLNVGIFAMASGTAWARVEAQAHYPSDVLFGMALGNFMAVFFTEAFMGFDSEVPLKISAVPARKGAILLCRVQF